MTLSARYGGTWRDVPRTRAFVKHAGVWKVPTQVWAKRAGVWQTVFVLYDAPGSTSFTTAGSHNFTIPNYSTSLTITLYGGGGGGGGGNTGFPGSGNASTYAAGSLSAGGGGGGGAVSSGYGTGGKGGIASGGTTNTNGGDGYTGS